VNTTNVNTSDYWNGVYRGEWESGIAESQDYYRDYGPIHDTIIGLIPGGSRVLDVACGPGLLCRKIKERLPSAHVTGVDFSEYVIARNQQRDAGLGITYRCLDARTGLAELEGGFDVVTMCEILEHLDNPEAVVAAANKLLAPGGRFILTCPHDNEIPDPEHVRVWGHDEVFHLLSPYSSTVSFMHFPPPYFHVWMLAYLTKCAAPLNTRSAE
jgi:2-polyprenyl-3-methyl-5-hydroxy-6-metoxy-1,4-benzoquinol methylase